MLFFIYTASIACIFRIFLGVCINFSWLSQNPIFYNSWSYKYFQNFEEIGKGTIQGHIVKQKLQGISLPIFPSSRAYFRKLRQVQY